RRDTEETKTVCLPLKQTYICPVIDYTKMHTLAAASTMQVDYSPDPQFWNLDGMVMTVANECTAFGYGGLGKSKRAFLSEVAKKSSEAIAKSCLEKGITKVAFDRGGYPYHRRVEAIADAARENGLQF
ncbi:hypothetical protein GIB67_008482, partial [Kingdonia uniflora]